MIVYVYFGYPLLLWIISLFIDSKHSVNDISPSVTFLITAYNEEKDLAEKLKNTLSLDYPKDKLEIIVASDGSTDKTDEIVKSFEGNGVKLLRVEGRVGKTETQNQAVKISHGDIIIFSDATTKYEQSAIKKIVRNFADDKIGVVGGRFRYYDPKQTQIGTGSIAFWDYDNFIKAKQTKINTITGCSGCIYSVKKNLYEPLPYDIISDLVEPLKILEKGFRIVFEPEAIAYETTLERSEEEFKMRVRVISRGMNGLLYMKSLLNPFKHPYISFQLISHKILRWLVPGFAVILYGINIFLIGQGVIYDILFYLQSILYLAATIGWIVDKISQKRKIKVFSMPLYFCVVNYAALVALFRTLMKRKDVKWETVR
jgi:cellulose synthase/poly-beta-1,6-N-acetylglucosamine synthase-like glycosyltransferase